MKKLKLENPKVKKYKFYEITVKFLTSVDLTFLLIRKWIRCLHK